MRLGKIKISNFRSISSIEFGIDETITAFVGGNETGKSNILKAINHFFSEEPFSQEDRYSLSQEEPKITIEFQLTEEENQKIEELSRVNINKKLVVSKTVDGKTIENEEFKDYKPPAENGEAEKSSQAAETITTTEKSENNKAIQEPQAEEIQLPENVEKEILEMLPKAIFVDVEGLIKGRNISIADMKANLNSPEYKTIANFLAVGDIGIETFEDTKDTSISQAEKSERLGKASATISQKLKEYWGQEDIQVEITTDNTYFTIRFFDGGNRPGSLLVSTEEYTIGKIKKLLRERDDSTRWIWTCPEERSDGFRWFVTFYSGYIHGIESGANLLLIVDNLGIFLHASAQRELLEKLKSLGIQVIYATHSFYMVSWDFRDKIFLVKKDEKGTVADHKWWLKLSSGEIESPLREIGINSVVNFLVLSEKNLIVDGLLDILALTRLSEIFSDKVTDPFLDFKFYAAQGYPDIKELGLLCKRLKNKAFLLYDSKPEEINAFRSARRKRLKASHLKSLVRIRSWPIQTIEDFLPRELFFNETDRVCRKIFGNDWIGFEKRGPVSPGILASLKSRIINAGVSDADYKEKQIEKIIKERVVPSVISLMKKENFINEDQNKAIVKLLQNLKAELVSIS